MIRPVIIPTTLLIVMAAIPMKAQAIDSLFMQGQQQYRDGAFNEAVASYELILSEGQTSDAIYYNLGNAYFRMGLVPRAILAYERALRIDPTDDDILHNLTMARLMTVDRIEALPELFIVTWVRMFNTVLGVDTTAQIFLAGWVLVFTSLSIMYLTRSSTVIKLMRLTFFSSGVITLLFGLLLALQVFLVPATPEGIIMSPTVTAKSSPDENSVDAFVVHEGLKVDVGAEVEEWMRITLADGKTGWIRKAELETI